MKRSGYIAFIVLIWLLCLVPALGMFLPGEEEAGGNQVLSAMPALRDRKGQLNQDYLPQVMDFVEDNYYLRQPMVTAWAGLNEKLLRSSISKDVVLGKDGWLYFGETLSDYTGLAPLPDSDIAAAAYNLHIMSIYCSNQRADLLVTIAPNKNSLYPEKMPKLTVYPPAASNAARLADDLDGWFVSYVDLFKAFRAQEEPLYFAQDSHWNGRGAALAADTILNFPWKGDSRYFEGPFVPATHKGDLYDMLCPAGEETEADYAYGPGFHFTYDQPIRSAENLTIMTTCEGKDGSLLMFRDSFGNNLYPYLAESFGHALFSRATAYRLDLIAERGADTVVIELVERNIPYLLQNVPVMPAPSSTSRPYKEGYYWQARAVLSPEGPEDIVLQTTPSREMSGYVLVKGALPEGKTPGAVYLLADGAYYKAFLQEDSGFGLYMPETALTGELSVIWSGGEYE